jgi:hypothetical protein
MSSGPSTSCTAGIGRSEAAERRDQIGADVGVGVLLDDERGRGVPQINQKRAVARADLFEKARHFRCDLEKTFAGRFHR